MNTKIHMFEQPLIWPTKFYLGFCGGVEVVLPVIEFFNDPTQFKKPPKTNGAGEFVILTEDKKLFMFFNPANWVTLNQPYYAIGSGMNYAMAAMECGKTPLEACKVASKFDPSTGMGFRHFDIGE